MRARVQKWGNSLALRIPKAFADEIGIKDDTVVDIVLADGTLTIVPLSQPAISLDDLLAGITAENIHGEVESGMPQGNEVW